MHWEYTETASMKETCLGEMLADFDSLVSGEEF